MGVASALRDAGEPFVKGHFRLADGECLNKEHGLLRSFAALAASLMVRRTDQSSSGWYDRHHRTNVALLDTVHARPESAAFWRRRGENDRWRLRRRAPLRWIGR